MYLCIDACLFLSRFGFFLEGFLSFVGYSKPKPSLFLPRTCYIVCERIYVYIYIYIYITVCICTIVRLHVILKRICKVCLW